MLNKTKLSLAVFSAIVSAAPLMAAAEEQADGFVEGSSLNILNRNFYMNRDFRKGQSSNTGRRQKLSATPYLSGTVLPPCLTPNSALKNAPPFKSVMPKVSVCVGLPA